MTWRIPLYKIFTDDEDVNLITKIIKRGNSWALGPEIEEFENELANYVGVDYCATLNSGTSALHACFLAYGLGNSDEIIVPSFSFISTANSVLFVGAKPIFADIEEETFGLDPDSIQSKINSNTKALVPMDYGGLPCKIFEINEIAKQKNIPVIEDAAESLGSKIHDSKIGSISDSSIFSFCGNKVLTTGEGGAVVTNSKDIYDKIKIIRSHGRIDTKNYFQNESESVYLQLGYNWRMSTLTATLGLTQLKKLDKLIVMRKKNAKHISSKLEKFKQIKFPSIPSGYDHIYQMFTIRLENQTLRDNLHEFLTKKQIFSKVYFSPIHKTKFYQGLDNKIQKLPLTEKIASEVLTLPLYPNMDSEELNYLTESMAEFFESLN